MRVTSSEIVLAVQSQAAVTPSQVMRKDCQGQMMGLVLFELALLEYNGMERNYARAMPCTSLSWVLLVSVCGSCFAEPC
jgi:hypothetical protein